MRRRIIANLASVLIGMAAGIGLMVCVWRIPADNVLSRKNALPESPKILRLKPSERARTLQEVSRKILRFLQGLKPGDMLAAANFTAAASWVDNYRMGAGSQILAIDSYIVRHRLLGMLCLEFHGVNLGRDTDQAIIRWPGKSGETVEAIYRLEPSEKNDSFVDARLIPIRLISRVELEAKNERRDEGTAYLYSFPEVLELPDNVPLILGLRDRSGEISNFVRVRRLQEENN